MKLRASEKPIATAGDIPVPTATPTASAVTVASIDAVLAVVIAIVPFGADPVAVSAVESAYALAVPPMWFTAIAPPPLKALLSPRLTATLMAEAVDVASIVELCDAAIVTLPPVACTAGTFRIAAASSVEISLRAMLMPTLTLVAFCAEAATASTGASTKDSMLAASDALTVTLPA